MFVCLSVKMYKRSSDAEQINVNLTRKVLLRLRELKTKCIPLNKNVYYFINEYESPTGNTSDMFDLTRENGEIVADF